METRQGVLYPLLVIAAIAVILFSLAGIAVMLGFLPMAQSRGESRLEMQTNPDAAQPRTGPRDAGGRDQAVPRGGATAPRDASPLG